MFRKGDRVIHEKHGYGTVLEDEYNVSSHVNVKFDGVMSGWNLVKVVSADSLEYAHALID